MKFLNYLNLLYRKINFALSKCKINKYNKKYKIKYGRYREEIEVIEVNG